MLLPRAYNLSFEDQSDKGGPTLISIGLTVYFTLVSVKIHCCEHRPFGGRTVPEH